MDDGGGEANDGIGVIPRVIRDLFDGLDERREVWDVVVTCSFFELYNEEINDLFANLSIRGGMKAYCHKDMFAREEDYEAFFFSNYLAWRSHVPFG